MIANARIVLMPSQRLFKLVTGPGEDVYRSVDLLDIAHAMADVEAQVEALELRLASVELAIYNFEANWNLGGHLEPLEFWEMQFKHLEKYLRRGIRLSMTEQEVATLAAGKETQDE